MVSFVQVQLPLPGFAALAREAAAEGYQFLETVQHEWSSGENRFSLQGEVFYGAYAGEELVAVGGLNRDPFLNRADVGRLRRIYVHAAWRGQGVGTKLVKLLLAEADKTFELVRLRAENAEAARLYERLGFIPILDPNATHILSFAAQRAVTHAHPDGL